MRGLTILVAGADAARFRAALELAASGAALGKRVRLFLHAPAVPLIAAADAEDGAHAAAGLPTRGELLDTALACGAEVVLCQSGLALAGLDAATLDTRIGTGGLPGLLATLGEDRLVAL